MTDYSYGWSVNGSLYAENYGENPLSDWQMSNEVMKLKSWNYGSHYPGKTRVEPSGISRADLIAFAGHAQPGAFASLYTDMATEGWYSSNASMYISWDTELEFVVIYGCTFLPHKHDQRDLILNSWVSTQEGLFGTGIHALLTTSGPFRLWEPRRKDFGQFVDYLKEGNTVCEAWKNALLKGLNVPYGILVRKSNEGDRLLTPVSEGDSAHLTRDCTATDNCSFMFYWYKNQSEEIVGGHLIGPSPSAQTSNRFATSDEGYRMKQKLDKAVRFTGSQTVPHYAVARQASPPVDVTEDLQEYFDYLQVSKWNVRASKDARKLKLKNHVANINVKSLTSVARKHGLRIPSDYVFQSESSMMAESLWIDENATVRPQEKWCEGKVFKFTRILDGTKMIGDECTVAIRNDDILFFSLQKHPLVRIGTQAVKKFGVIFDDRDLTATDIHTRLIYDVTETRVIPVWEIQCRNYIFRYNAITGKAYYEKP